MSIPDDNPLARRVPESRVAAILSAIADPPGRRTAQRSDDPPGDFDFWFDGGGCKYHTGSAHYCFTDGTIAIVACPAAWLWVRIQFTNQTTVKVLQTPPTNQTTAAYEKPIC